MRIKKADNPYEVKVGQLWREPRTDYKAAPFMVLNTLYIDGEAFAECLHKKQNRKTLIALANFGRYIRK